jgi:NADPH2:quinone reductase
LDGYFGRRRWPLLDQGAVAPIVERTFSLADASAAYRVTKSSEHVGKNVLMTRSNNKEGV